MMEHGLGWQVRAEACGGLAYSGLAWTVVRALGGVSPAAAMADIASPEHASSSGHSAGDGRGTPGVIAGIGERR